MGIIRFFLALAVVVKHISAPKIFHLCHSGLAVQAFFMISGFYMAMAYRHYHSNLGFWLSRYIRIYPTYIVCCILTLWVYTPERYFTVLEQQPSSTWFILVVTQLSLFFQDITLWVRNENHFFQPFWTIELVESLHAHTLLKQAWSLGVELSFYLITPFIINSQKRLLVTIRLGVIVGFVLISIGLLPLRYHSLLPISVSFFALGALSFHYKKHLLHLLPCYKAAVLPAVMYIIFYQYLPGNYIVKNFMFCAILFVIMPAVFEYSKNIIWDNFLGSLSYPIYCSHILVAYLIYPPSVGSWFFQNTQIFNMDVIPYSYALVIILGTIIFSILLRYVIEKPIEKLRKSMRMV